MKQKMKEQTFSNVTCRHFLFSLVRLSADHTAKNSADLVGGVEHGLPYQGATGAIVFCPWGWGTTL